uniref:Uncharacterized protein n=1 Tax=Oryza sativa subsp. japonica TaxID=39947 RepID=Q6ZDB1_ORYSJ|nr:hypothetical protein [Oryza sativa Japonica Group]BAC92431.1 hypothetical protein [Oryza sativa Japonica Group]
MNAGPPAASLPLDPVEGRTPPPGRHCLPSPSAISGMPELAHRVAAASSPAGSDGGEGTAAAVTPGCHRLPSPPVGSGTSGRCRLPSHWISGGEGAARARRLPSRRKGGRHPPPSSTCGVTGRGRESGEGENERRRAGGGDRLREREKG